MAINRLKFIQDCAQLIAINGCSFAVLAKSGFESLISDKLGTLADAGYAEGLTAPLYPAVREYIAYQAAQIEKKIKNEVQGKYVALMVDGASKNGKSFLGLSIQFVFDGRMVVRNIGILEILDSHCSLNLMNEIMTRLHFFGIEKSRLIGITSDNAPNMLATVKRFNTHNEGDADGVDDEDNLEVDEDNDGEELMTESEIEKKAMLDQLLDDNQEYTALIESHLSKYAKETMDIYGIKCAAHTLQLVVLKAINTSEYGHLIASFRNVCKHLRKPTSIRLMKQNGIRIWLPRLDVETRWSSLYRMVCDSYNQRAILHRKWLVALTSTHTFLPTLFSNNFIS